MLVKEPVQSVGFFLCQSLIVAVLQGWYRPVGNVVGAYLLQTALLLTDTELVCQLFVVFLMQPHGLARLFLYLKVRTQP